MWREGEHLPSAGEPGAKLGCRPGWSGPRPVLTAEFLNTDQSQEDFRLHQLYCQFIMMHRLCTEIHDIFQVLYLCFTGSNLCTSSWMNISVTQYQAQMGTQPHIWVDLMGALVTKDETRRGYILDGSVVAREIAISWCFCKSAKLENAIAYHFLHKML